MFAEVFHYLTYCLSIPLSPFNTRRHIVIQYLRFPATACYISHLPLPCSTHQSQPVRQYSWFQSTHSSGYQAIGARPWPAPFRTSSGASWASLESDRSVRGATQSSILILRILTILHTIAVAARVLVPSQPWILSSRDPGGWRYPLHECGASGQVAEASAVEILVFLDADGTITH